MDQFILYNYIFGQKHVCLLTEVHIKIIMGLKMSEILHMLCLLD